MQQLFYQTIFECNNVLWIIISNCSNQMCRLVPSHHNTPISYTPMTFSYTSTIYHCLFSVLFWRLFGVRKWAIFVSAEYTFHIPVGCRYHMYVVFPAFWRLPDAWCLTACAEVFPSLQFQLQNILFVSILECSFTFLSNHQHPSSGMYTWSKAPPSFLFIVSCSILAWNEGFKHEHMLGGWYYNYVDSKHVFTIWTKTWQDVNHKCTVYWC